MLEIKVDFEELKAAISELEARGKSEQIGVKIIDRQLRITCEDRNDNMMEAILYDNNSLGAQFRMTHRLMYMKDKKRI